ncbi:helix-turn-helix transcriptional regulator [Agarivorans sp. QJM3NY_33]|uniref:helix-turn-helix transcriptional regulator n=1 Tax=Agarivorans sp. QJM3NY_33 TaxID=3421432 RepID=UPI003D7EFF36
MENLSIRNVSTFEHLELDAHSQSWVRSINHCFTEDTTVENAYLPGLYITLLGQCQYSTPNSPQEKLDNYNYHYAVALADEPCTSSVVFPSNATWQTLSIMLPLAQLHEYGISSVSEVAHHFRPEARISELGAISGDILRCCESVWQCEFKGLERQLFIRAKAFEVLSLFLHKRREDSQYGMSSRMSQLREALNHVEDNLDQDWTLSSLARLAGSNQTYIKQDIKGLVGTSFRKWLNKKRLNIALELLSGDAPIHQIADDIGIKSQAYLATLFKGEFGLSPSEYRQALLLKRSA